MNARRNVLFLTPGQCMQLTLTYASHTGLKFVGWVLALRWEVRSICDMRFTL